MTAIPLRRKSRCGGILKGLLTLLGGITLLAILAVIGAGWYAKTQVDKAGGLQAFSGKMMAKGLDLLRPQIEKSLAPSDRKRLAESLASGQRIEIRGFGSFSLHCLPPRPARNPKTGEAVFIGHRCKLHFKPGLEMRNRVNPAQNDV